VTVRDATPADVQRLLELADLKSHAYEPFAPTFHRPAANATELHRPWVAGLVADANVGAFVHENSSGVVDGFVIATTGLAPPVYDPGGATSLIDDFAVASPDLWKTSGAALRTVACEWAGQPGAVKLVVVSGPHDTAKRDLLRAAGLYVASEWFTSPLT